MKGFLPENRLKNIAFRLLAVLICFTPLRGNTQNECFSFRIETANAQPGDTVVIAVTVRDFVGIVGYGFALEWSPTDLQFIKHSTTGSLLSGQLINPQASAQGILRTIWYDENATGVTLPDKTFLFRMHFKVLAQTAGFYPVKINPSNFPTYYDVSNVSGQQLPLNNVYGGAQVGQITDLALDTFCILPPFCAGQYGSVFAHVSGGVAPFQFHWAGPDGFTANTQNLEHVLPGQYELTIIDAQGAVAKAVARFYAGASTMQTAVSTVKAKCESANGCALVSIYNGFPPYAVEWSIPGSTYPNRCDLPGGEHSITITDAAGCKVETSVFIEKDTAIGVTLTPVFKDCRFQTKGSIQTSVTGTPPYTYEWSNGDATANVSNLEQGDYTVRVVDASGCVGSATTTIKDYGTFDWSFSASGTCRVDTALAKSSQISGYALAQRTNPPLSIVWSNGTRHELTDPNESLVWETMTQVKDLPNGNYAVTITDADGCSEVEKVVSGCNLYEPFGESEPVFYMKSYSNPLGTIYVYGKGLRGIKKIKFSLVWNTSQMTLDGTPYSTSLPGVSNNSFTIDPAGGRIDFQWESPGTEGVHTDYELRFFTLDFLNNTVNSSYLDFLSDNDDPVLLEHFSGERKAFIGRSGSVYFTPPSTFFPSAGEFGITPANCYYDGFHRIQFEKHIVPYTSFYKGLHSSSSSERLPVTDLYYARPGNFSFTVESASYTVSIPPYEPLASECLWPGDADNNDAVNHFDLLYLGLGMGHSDTPRKEIDSLWHGVTAADWPETTQTRHINFKHFDPDGNGLVEPADTLVLLRHWGKMVDLIKGTQPYSMSARPDSLLPQPALHINADTVEAGVAVKLPVSFQTANTLGLAFSLTYNPALMAAPPHFEPASTWFGDPVSNLIYMQKDFPGQNRLDVALTRSDGQAVSGDGEIGHLVCTFKQLPPDSLQKAVLFLAHALAITPAEQLLGLGETRKEILFRGRAVSGVQTPNLLDDREIILSPNPAARELNLESRQSPIQQVIISDAKGSFQQSFSWETPAQRVQIDLSKCPAGACFARVVCENGVAIKKFVVLPLR